MSAEAAATVLRQAIADELGIGIDKVTPGSLLSTLGLTSMCVLDVIAALPDDWDADALIGGAEYCRTVQDLIDLL